MANASSRHIGAGAQGKSDGSGAMTDIDKDMLPENMVLSNRDKSQHSRERGLDSKAVQTEQFHDHGANHLKDDDQ
nr:class I SAM-dependent methyltransferase [Rhizobium sp. Q54]